MARIKPFSAIRPIVEPLELELLKLRLEPKGTGLVAGSYQNARAFLANLIQQEQYGVDGPSIYIYSHQAKGEVASVGIWTLTSAEDFSSGKILPHENTLELVQQQIFTYRDQVAIEGAAVLLAYPQDQVLSWLIAMICSGTKSTLYSYAEVEHRIWRVQDKGMISSFQQAFMDLEFCYIADGHHRAAAAVRLAQNEPTWVSSLYLAVDQITFSAFHRLVNPSGLDRRVLLAEIAKRYYMSYIPHNRPYRPDRKGRLGMFFAGVWYQLNPRAEQQVEFFGLPDVVLLQEQILAPSFGILQPGTDQRLRCYDDDAGWIQLLSELAKDENLIAFTLFAMEGSDLISCADQGLMLPPKSTCILPKVPYGLLMHDLELEGELVL